VSTIPDEVRSSYGSLPDGWRLGKLKFSSAVRNSNVDKVIADDEVAVRLCNYTDVYYNDRITPDLKFKEGSATSTEIECFQLQRGQVIITKDSESWEDIGIPALVTEDMPDVLCGYHLSVLDPAEPDLDGHYLAWLCRSEPLNNQFKLGANGVTRFGLGQYSMKNSFIALPPLETQRRIARFLDDKTARIDALIEKKRALLDRLAEKRQALITHAVTKGLDPAAPMKDSSIDWLGQIPAHWEVVALNKVTTKITNGYVGPTRDIFFDEGVRYIQSLHIKSNQIIFKDDFFVAEDWSHAHAKSILRLDDVLVVQTGDIGQVARVTDEFVGCNCHALIICSPEPDRLDGGYLSWLFNSDYGQEFLHLVKTGALHPHLNCGHVKFFDVLIPPMDEQLAISRQLDENLNAITGAVDAVQKSVERLTEYRAALITAAVTGQPESETYYLAASPKNAERLNSAIAEAETGNTQPHEPIEPPSFEGD
ncbi:MAG: restriction endonuclease subunit S, partial [Ktedonobacteraceae bacterium]